MFVRYEKYHRRSWFRGALARIGAALIILSGARDKSIYLVEHYGVFIRRVS